MSSGLNENKIRQVLDFTYDKAISGIAGFDSAIVLAENYKQQSNCLQKQCSSLVKWQVTKAGTSGFITGLGGLLLMPVTLPANVTSVLYIQIRMIAAIAHLAGHNLQDDRVKTMVYLCLVGNSATEILKNVGIEFGKKIATNVIKNISTKTITQINQKVGFRLVTKFGEKGIINLGKSVPLLGGIIGGTTDIVSTKIIAKTAIHVFAK